MSSIRKKLGIQFFASNSATIVYFLMSLILSRLLSPKEIGIFSITAVLVGFTHVFRDFGVASYIRRQKLLTDEILRASIGVLFTSSWIIAVLLYISADYWAIYFDQPGIRQIMHIQAIGFLIIPFGSIPQAVLIRNMDVEKTTIVTFFSVIAYGATCVILAYLGFSYMSMAWANLVNIVVSSLGLMWLSPKGLPWVPSFKGWQRVVHFGAGAMMTSALKAIDAAIPDFLLGKISGPHDVGLFSRGNSTVNIFNSIASPTVNFFALPYLAKTHHGGQNVGNEVGRSIGYLSGIIWPASIVMAVMAKSFIIVLYGEKWVESAVVIPWLCVCAAIQIGFIVLQPALTALNKPYLSALPVALLVVVKIVLGIATFDGNDLVSFARAVAIAEISAIPIYLFLLDRYVGLKVADWLRAVSGSLKVCGFVSLQIIALKFALPVATHPLVQLLLAAAWITPGWILAIFLFNHPLKIELLNTLAFARSFLPGNTRTTREKKSGNPYRVVIYGAVSAPIPAVTFWKSVKSSVRVNFVKMRDSLFWRFGSLNRLDYRSYLAPGVVNRGDQAITQATRQHFSKYDSNIEFIDLDWGELSTLLHTEQTREIDLIVIAGSGYFTLDSSGVLPDRIGSDLETLNSISTPMVLYGIGVNQLLGSPKNDEELYLTEQSQELLRQVLLRASLISVRDQASQVLLSQFSEKTIELNGDPALYFVDRPDMPQNLQAVNTTPVIGINFALHGPLANTRMKRNIDRYIMCLKKLQKLSGCRYVYLAHFDAELILPKLLEISGIETDVVFGTPDILASAYKKLNLHIGEMLHSNILATSAGTPAIAIAYDIKHMGFFKLLGIEQYCFSSVSFDEDAIINAAIEVLQNENLLRKNILARRQILERETDQFVGECMSLITQGPIPLQA